MSADGERFEEWHNKYRPNDFPGPDCHVYWVEVGGKIHAAIKSWGATWGPYSYDSLEMLKEDFKPSAIRGKRIEWDEALSPKVER